MRGRITSVVFVSDDLQINVVTQSYGDFCTPLFLLQLASPAGFQRIQFVARGRSHFCG